MKAYKYLIQTTLTFARFFTTMLLEGIILGLSLSFMVGPLLFAILQAGIERGFRAGLSVAGGIWASDMLYVLAVMYSLEALAALTALPGFRLWAGLAGGALLVAFGLGNLFFGQPHPRPLPHREGRRRASRVVVASPLPVGEGSGVGLTTYFLRGFLLNTVNPFTVFFWLGITGAVLIPNGWNHREMLVFFSGMLGTLVVTDTLKAYAAKRIRHFLTPRHTMQLRQAIGLLLIVFGVVLVARVV